MLQIIISLSSILAVALSANVTQSPLPNIESGVVVVYESSSTTIQANTETNFQIKYSKTHSTPPTPFYFLNRYKMKDRFVYENFYSYIKSADVDKWKLAVEPVSSTSILVLSISYVAMQNIYDNFFVKEYTYGSEAGLATGTGARSYTATYNFSQEFIGRSLSGTFSQNKLITSWVGFWRSSSASPVCDMYINSYFSNISFYAIAISTSTSSMDFWNRTNVMACIINMEKFPSTVKLLSGTVVLSPSNSITSWTEFQKFTNVSYCFGYSGINTNTNESQDMYWTEHNNTAIKAYLSFLNYGRYSYLILWNEIVIPDPVPPVDPSNTTNTTNNTNNTTNNNTNTNSTPIAPVDPADPHPLPNPNPDPTPKNDSSGNGSSIDPRQQQSNSPIGIIIGVVAGVIVLGAIIIFLIYRHRHNKGNRVQIPQNLKEFHIFTPSFV